MSFESLRSFRILGLKPPANDPRDAVDQMLDRDIHDSEGLRAVILAAVLTVTLAVYVYACYERPEIPALLPERSQRILVGASLGIALLIAILIKPASVLLKSANRPPPLGGRLISAFLETSLPTVMIFALTARAHTAPVNALLLPPVFFYFPLIILSILRFDRRISIFTGLVAGLEYGALAWSILGHGSSGDGALEQPSHHLIKALVLVLSGVIAGEVSARFRRWIRDSNAMTRANEHAEAERKRTLDRFGQHVSPAVAARLLERELSSEIRHVCVMFLDIRDFTAFSEKRGPEEVVAYLNTLFGSMIDSVNAHNGIINKFLGDGFMAVFGAPLSDGRDCRNALDAAREIVEGVAARVAEGAIPPTRVGIGLHAGPAVTGVIGTAKRGEYTVIGDVVNVASRIESMNKEFGTCLLVSDEVLAAIGQDRPGNAVSRGAVKVKGRSAAVQLFQLA